MISPRCWPVFLFLVLPPRAAAVGPPPLWPAEVREALARSADNRAELVRALEQVPATQRAGMRFLVANMPARDLRKLSAKFLLENVALAYKARAELPWGREVPEAIFLNDVLPYANLDESRDPWRKEMYDLCLPLVKDCKTPGEAAVKLNATLFGKLKVRYSTQRKKPNQSPKESIESGLASCSGLSVLLVDACRSVGVPARVAGTPLWHNKRGNHTWVEVWDGRWKFTGAAEPGALDTGWFVGDAARATKGSAEHAIFAASFRRTKQHFPLVWAPRNRDVFAEDVSDRYTAKRSPATDRVRVQVRVRVAGTRERLALPVTIEERRDNCEVCRDRSRGETADTNDLLTVELLPDRDYVVRVGSPVLAEKEFRTAAAKALLVEVEVPKPFTADEARDLEKELVAYFAASADKQAKWAFDKKLEALLARNEPAARHAAWKAYRAADIHQATKKDFDAKQVRYDKHTSAYTLKTVGKKPAGGWPLVIAMHGGGGVPKRVNDSQWQVMQRYYRDQTEGTGYAYVALRAPNDTWNGFYDSYVPPLVSNLIRQFLLFGEVDANKVYLLGYSHGGYGAFYIGPRIPDRFAAVHASAAAPSDANTIARNLRNTVFTFMIGEKDTAYGRIKRCEEFDAEVQKLKKANKGAYPVTMELKKGMGHGGLPDRDKIKEMIALRRTAAPKRVTWEVSGGPIDRFFWLRVPKAEGGQVIDAAIDGQTITVTTTKAGRVELAVDRRLVSFDKPLTVVVNGKKQAVTAKASLVTLCRTLAERGDPELAATCLVGVEVEGEKKRAQGVAVSVSPPANTVGADILAKGGTAVDAAVAVGLALAVTWPEAGNLGGGGFMLIRPAGQTAEPVVIDYREAAPAAATRDLFVKNGKKPYLTVGVPGSVAGMHLAHQKYGKLPWKDLVAPAIKLAEEGFVIDDALARSLNAGLRRGKNFPEMLRVFGKDGKATWKAGDRLVQKDLARTLRAIAAKGDDGFYKGEVAELLVKEMKAGGGLITLKDLAGYQAKGRKPIHGTFRGHDVYAPPPPSSGGVCLIQMLNVLENYDLKKQGRYSATTLHLMAEAMRRAYLDRARHLGDPDFVKIPAHLTSKEYAKKLAGGIDPKKATKSEALAKDIELAGEGENTTHYSVIDADGMAVSTTTTLEDSFGSKIVVKGAGFLLNNEMTDFNPRPGETTRKGQVGTPPNVIAPGKRMLSSMTPVIVVKDGVAVLVTGSPGGRTIINTVLGVVLNVVEFGMSAREAVDAPRMHMQWFPDRVQVEEGLLTKHAAEVKKLEALGHKVLKVRAQGDAHTIGRDAKTGKYQGVMDARRAGRPAAFKEKAPSPRP